MEIDGYITFIHYLDTDDLFYLITLLSIFPFSASITSMRSKRPMTSTSNTNILRIKQMSKIYLKYYVHHLSSGNNHRGESLLLCLSQI